MKFLKRPANAKPKKGTPSYEGQKEIAYVVIGGVTLLLMFYVLHCTWVSFDRQHAFSLAHSLTLFQR